MLNILQNAQNMQKRIMSEKIYKSACDLFFELKNCTYANVKGECLSLLAYNKNGYRQYNDLDILVPRKSISEIEKTLNKLGYSKDVFQYSDERKNRIFLLSSSHQIIPYTKDVFNKKIVIDLNFNIFWGEYTGKQIDIEEFLADTIEIDIYGQKIKTLSPAKALMQLILHHYKDMNSLFLLATRKSIKYDIFNDIYNLLKNNLNNIELEKLYSMCKEYEIIPYVFYVLYHTGQLFSDIILNEYIDTFRTAECEALLNTYGLSEHERKEWKIDFTTRLENDILYEYIKDDLTEKDLEKIAINKSVFLGE